MPEFTQDNRPLRINTDLGPDAVLLTHASGTEEISKLFQFSLGLVAPVDKPVDFSKILGQPACVELDQGEGTRFFHGFISRFSQGIRDDHFIHYRAELVPQFWFLTKREQSRIFQHLSVPEILKLVLEGLKVDNEIQGSFDKRDYCVQYRESDFAFASRLMEEEGIFWFFKHAKGEHRLVLANTPQSHTDLPTNKKLIYETLSGGNREEGRVQSWEKVQEIRSGKVTLWDHCFELPHKHLESDKTIPDSVQAGKVSHKLKLSGVDKLELYDYPGGYSQRFDGVDRGGGDQPAELDKIFKDNKRTVGIRLQEEAALALQIQGSSDCSQMHAGFKFSLERHFDADGDYYLTQVSHDVQLGTNVRSGIEEGIRYTNHFTCVPLAVPYRPQRKTPRPTVHGSQTAVVVGPAGEEIFTDKYSRVKVQFHWDRQGKNDADSSCWIRVSTMWAGRNWGMIHIPRIGQEVIVDFLEGDPDQPIIVGSVYNADMMPPFELPGNKTQSGIQTRSSPGGSGANCNQIRFEDKAGAEQVHIHAEKNQDIEVENDETHWVGHDRKKTIDNDETTHVKHDRTETVDNNETIAIGNNRAETVAVNESIDVGANRSRTVGGNETVAVAKMRTHTVGINEAIAVGAAQEIVVGGLRSVTVGAVQTITVGLSQDITVGRSQSTSVGKDDSLTVGGNRAEEIAKDHGQQVGGKRTSAIKEDDTNTVGKNLVVTAGDSITFTTGDASITMKKDGTIIIKGKDITIDGSGEINVKASKNIVMKGKKILQN
ncbi:MAG: type VI secretion system tip protein VgrG [Planctomycetes bacterium]|nr:type VI secretion system tip protein VgrG [Planctomycetota bacterium]